MNYTWIKPSEQHLHTAQNLNNTYISFVASKKTPSQMPAKIVKFWHVKGGIEIRLPSCCRCSFSARADPLGRRYFHSSFIRSPLDALVASTPLFLDEETVYEGLTTPQRPLGSRIALPSSSFIRDEALIALSLTKIKDE